MRRQTIAAVAAPLILGSCSIHSGHTQDHQERNFIHLSRIVSTYPELGPAVCYTSREQGEAQLREISKNADGYQDWIFIERGEGDFWANLYPEYRSINALGYRLFSVREIKSLRLVRKQDRVTHYVTCPDTGQDVDSYSLKANLPSPKDFLNSKSVKDAVEGKGAVSGGSISISPHLTCEFGNTGNYTSEPAIDSRLHQSFTRVFSKKDGVITEDKLAELSQALADEGLFLRVKRHLDNQQR